MKLTLYRQWPSDKATVGIMYVEGGDPVFTLEDVIRVGAKVPGATAIPAGVYTVCVDFSNRFQRLMPHVLNVPGFEGIRIHSGNTAADTDGCILVGLNKGVDVIGASRLAFDGLFPLLQKASDAGEPITIEIQNNPPPVQKGMA